jgi:endoglucanase
LADNCEHAADYAWQWASAHPDLAYDQQAINRQFSPAITTGAYGDRNFKDEWFWAAAELTVNTRDSRYAQVVREQLDNPLALPSWSNVGLMGGYTLLRYRDSLPTSWQPVLRSVKERLLAIADGYVEKLGATAFHTVVGESRTNFVWGSNSVAANQGMLLINAWLLTNDHRYLGPALANLDYLLGRNATGYCFVTGIGAYSPRHPHHRPSIADGVDAPVPGLLVGGPNPGQQDHQRYTSSEPETSYTDQDQAYASNEIAINWNAPLVYLAGAIDALEDRL